MQYTELERTMGEREAASRVNQELLEKTMGELGQRKAELLELRAKASEAEHQAHRAKDLQREIDELNVEIGQLQVRIAELAKSPFMNDTQGQVNVLEQIHNAEAEVRKLTAEREVLEEETQKLKYENEDLQTQIAKLQTEIDTVNQDIETFKQDFAGETAGQLINARSPEEFNETMEKLRSVEGVPKWARVNFLQPRPPPGAHDPKALRDEIGRLKLERGQLAAELQKVEALRQARDRIDNAKADLTRQMDELEKKMERLPHEEEEIKQRPGPPLPERDVDLLSDFSAPSQVSELPPNYNTLLVLVIGGRFYERALQDVVGLTEGEVAQLATKLESVFYDHDIKLSNMELGLAPRYSLNIEYMVEMGMPLLKHMYENAIEITCYVSRESGLKAIGRALLPLKDLLDKILTSRSWAEAFVGKSASIMGIAASEGALGHSIGELRYKLRLRHDMYEEVKSFMDRHSYRAALRGPDQQEISPTEVRSFTIHVLECRNLRPPDPAGTLAPFVYYNFYNKWHTTRTLAGANPAFDDVQSFDVPMSKEFLTYLETIPLEFVIFNDKGARNAASVDQAPDNVMLGRAQLSLAELLKAGDIRESLQILPPNGQENVGEIVIQASCIIKKAEPQLLSAIQP